MAPGLARRDGTGRRNACEGAPDMAIMQPSVQTSPWQGAGVSLDGISAGLGWRRILASGKTKS